MGTHKLRLQGRPALGLVVWGHGGAGATPHRTACRHFAPPVSAVPCNREQLAEEISSC
jgi:hypothetical protein